MPTVDRNSITVFICSLKVPQINSTSIMWLVSNKKSPVGHIILQSDHLYATL